MATGTDGSSYDVIVLGGGTMGTAAAWALGKRGVRALVLEQFQHVHAFGAHGGRTRIIRHAYAESPDYVPLVQQADRLWLELEELSGQRILVRTGGLEMSAAGYSHAAAARASAQRWGLPFETLDAAELRRRYPQWRVPGDWDIGFSPQAGYLRTEPALRAMAAAARARGVAIHEDEAALAWRPDGAGYVVETTRGCYRADRLIVTAGAWAGRRLADLGLPLTVLRKTLFWFAVPDPAPFAPERFPVFITSSELGEIYGFPVGDEPGLKVACHSGGEPTDPAKVDRTVHPGEEAPLVEFLTRLLPGAGRAVVDSAVCLYTMTPDSDFILDRHPVHQGVVIGAGFSGHGFKFAPAIGEHLADLALDPITTPYPRLSLARLRPVAAG